MKSPVTRNQNIRTHKRMECVNIIFVLLLLRMLLILAYLEKFSAAILILWNCFFILTVYCFGLVVYRLAILVLWHAISFCSVKYSLYIIKVFPFQQHWEVRFLNALKKSITKLASDVFFFCYFRLIYTQWNLNEMENGVKCI